MKVFMKTFTKVNIDQCLLLQQDGRQEDLVPMRGRAGAAAPVVQQS